MSAIAKREPAADLVLRVEQARELLAQARNVDEVKDIHDAAKAAKVYLREQRAAIEVQQDAGEIHLRAQRRLGELLKETAETGARQGRGDAGRAVANRPKAQPEPLVKPAPPTLADLGIEKSAAQRFRAVAEVAPEKFEGYVEAAREGATEITTAGLLNHASRRNPHAASNVNNGEPDKNERFTPEWWIRELKERWQLNWDLAGHPAAPATRVFGRKHIWTIEDDCFRQDLSGKRGLGNWEWDDLNRFVPWAWLMVRTGALEIAVQPMPGNRFEQRFAQEFIEPFRPDEGGSGVRIHFPRRRVGYGTILDPEGTRKDNSPGLPSAAVIFEGPFIRSPDVPPVGTIDEVIADVRHHFGEDQKGMEHLWRQALQLARGGGKPAGYVPLPGARNMFVRQEPHASTAPLGSLLSEDRFTGEALDLGFRSNRLAGKRLTPCWSLRCSAKGCKVEFRVARTAEGLIGRGELQQLREHAQQHRTPYQQGLKRRAKRDIDLRLQGIEPPRQGRGKRGRKR